MGPTLLVLILALVAGSQAGPIQTEVSIGNQCSRECTVSNKFNYEPGTTYEFQYENEIRTAVQGASEDHAGLIMTAKVHMDFITQCEVVMRISDVQMKEHDPETATMKATNTALAALLERNPVRVSYQDGHIEHMCLSAQEAPEIVNIKRGMLSVFQNNMDDITKAQTVSESDVTGRCETEYTSEEKGWYNQQIKKSKNLLGCSERNGYNSAIQGIPYSSQSKVQSLPLLKSTHDCEQEVVRASGRLVSALCQEKHTFAPFSRHDSGATTHNTQRLTFVSESKTKTKPVPVSTRVPLQFDHSYNPEMQRITMKDLESKLMEVCETTKNGVRPETPHLFTSLVNTMKKMEASDMAAVYEKIKSKAVCAENNKIVKKFFLDAIPMTGSSSGLKMMTSLITSQEVSGVEADMWLTTLSFIQHPTVSMLAEIKPLLSLTKNAEKAMLSVSSLVNNLCKNTPRCNNIPEVRKIISILDSKVGACKVTKDNFETTLLALRSISNTGFVASSLMNRLTLAKCIKLSNNPIEIRLSAIEAFGMAACNADKTELMNVYTNTEEDSEVRIAAYKALMRCPSTDILRKVKVTLGKEEVNQVGSYVWSHLTNLMKTSEPHKQAIRSILDDSILQKEFNMDKRKFSRNYEGSMFIEKINAGAGAEADLIWSSKSFIPRSAMANLTVDLFGNAVNLFEIGGRVEGLEYFLEAYFGPNGHFSENDVQAAADETGLELVKGDKVKRINKRMSSAMDDLRGSLYMKVFGNELRYMNFQGLDSLLAQNSINFLDILMKLKDGSDYQFTQSAIFMDSSIIVPTSSGFPLNLTINGTATVDLKASGKMDVLKLTSSPPTLDVQGEIRPSGAVMISSMMSVDAFVTKVGIKMVSSLHSNTAIKGRMSLADGHIFNMELDAPEEKMDVFSVKSSFFTVHRDMEREQRMITENRQQMKSCTGRKFAKITGLELCGEVQFPNASLVENAPYFPMTGPVNMAFSLNKKDSLTSYKFEARSTHTKKQNVVRLAFSTPNGKVDRSFGINFDLNKVDGTFDTSLTSPWTNADFKGAVVKTKKEMGVNGKLNFDNSLRYEVKAHVKSAKSGPGMAYTPTLVVRSPGMTPIELTGTVKYAAWKLLDIDTTLEGITKAPITFKTTVLNKLKLMRFSASVASGKTSPYRADVVIQKTQLKTKVTYKPQISIRTPTAEVFAFGGSVAYAYGKNIIVQGKLDKVFSKPVSFKNVLKVRAYRRGRVLYNTKLDFRSPVADIKMRTKLDNRNMKSLATDIDLTYVIRRYARDSIKVVSKIVNLSSKALKKGKANVIMTSKKNPEINFKFTGNVNHNKKHSEIDADFVYGPNPKDADKQISLSVSMDRKIRNWAVASAGFKGEFALGKGLRMVSRIKHAHTKKSLDSSVMLRLNKQAVSSSLTLSDKSAAHVNVAGSFDLSYPGKSLSVAQTVMENKANDFTSIVNAKIGKGKHTIVTSWKKETPTSLTISSNVSLSGFDPLHVEGMYNLNANTYKASALLSKGKSTYRIASVSSLTNGKQVDISSEIEYPSRHIIANFEGSKAGDRYTGRTDLRWNADRDDTQRITILGNGQYLGADNIDGSLTLQYLSRTISANLKHTAKNKFNTHVDFKWAQNKQVSMDTSFAKYDKKGSRVMSGSLKLKTPFQNVKSLDVSVENEMEDAEYKTKVNIEWNPKNIISAIATLKRPLSLQHIDAELVAKTPFKSVKNIKATLRHKVKQGIKTVGKFGWNKKSAQFDLTLINTSNNRRTDVRGQLDIKSTFKTLKVASISLSHNSNDKDSQSNINFQHDKNKYSVENSLHHVVNGWNVNSNGQITITSPSDTIVSKWDHSNTLSEIASSVETTWGKQKRVYVKYSGRQDLAWGTGILSSALEIQTPFKRVRDIIFQINHEHRPSQIDSILKITNEGTQLAIVKGKYLMEDGQFTSSFVLNDITADAEARYTTYPLSGRLEVTVSPKTTVTVDGTYNKDNNGNVDGTVKCVIPNIDPITVSVQRIAKKSGFDSVAKLQYQNDQIISLESTYRLNKNKMVTLKFVSPFTQDCSAEVSLKGTAEHFDARASIEALPLVPRWSATASFDSRTDLNGAFRVNTPFTNVTYSQVSFNSYASDGARTSSLTIEYAPGNKIETSSVYKLYNANDVELSLKVKTPCTQMPYGAFAITHKRDLRRSTNHAELEYAMGKKVSVDTRFAMENGIDGSLNINTPFTEDITVSISHKGVSTDFQTHGDFTWGTTHSIDIKHEGTLKQFKCSIDISTDSTPYAGMISFVQEPTMITEVSFESPIKGWKTVKFAHSLNGNLAAFSNVAELHISKYGKFSTDINVDTVNTKSASIAINTPYKKYSNMRAALSHDGSMRQFQTKAEIQNGNDKVVGNIKFNVEPSINFELSLKTPIAAYRSSRVAFTFDGKSNDFKVHGEAQLNKATHEADLIFDNKKKLSIDMVIKSPFTNTIKASFDHWGSMKKFTSRLNVKAGKAKTSSEVRFQTKPSFKASVSIKSPFKMLKHQQFTLKHAGTAKSFKCNMLYKCNGKVYVGDAAFQNLNAMKAEMSLKGPEFKPIKALITHEGPITNFRSSADMSMGKDKIQASANLNTMNGLKGSVAFTSPIKGYKSIKAAVTHSGTIDNFRCHGEAFFNKQRGQIDIEFDSTNGVSSSIAMATPFKGYETMSASLKHTGTIKNFNTLVQYVQKSKSVEGQIKFDLGKTVTGNAVVRSQFKAIKNLEMSFNHEGSTSKFDSRADMTFDGQRSDISAQFDSTDGYNGGFRLNSPLTPSLDGAFSHSSRDKSCNTNVQLTIARETYSIDLDMNGKTPLGANLKIKTPTKGYEYTEALVHFDGSKQDFVSKAELTFKGIKHSIELHSACSSDIQTKLFITSPLMRNVAVTFEFSGPLSNFKTAFEYILAGDSMLNSELSLQTDGPISGDFKLKAKDIEAIKAQFSHEGQLNDFSTRAHLVYAGRNKIEGAMSFKFITDIEGAMRFTSPFCGDIEVTFTHNGPLSNCRTAGNVIYDGESQVSLNSNIRLEPTIDGELTIKSALPEYSQLILKGSHAGKLSDFKTHAEVLLSDHAITGDIAFNPRQGSLSLRTPWIEDIDGHYTIEGKLPNIESEAQVSYGSTKVFDATANVAYPSSAEFVLSLPVPEYKKTRMAITNDISEEEYASHAEIQVGGLTHQAELSVNSNNARLSLKSPMITPTTFRINYPKTSGLYQYAGEFEFGDDSHAVEVTFGNGNKIQGSISMKSPLMSDLSGSFETNTNINKLNMYGTVTYGSQTLFNADLFTNMIRQKSVSVNIEIPNNIAKTSVSLSGNANAFKVHGEAFVNRQLGDVDVSFDMTNGVEGSLTIKSPLIPLVALSINHNGNANDLTSHGEIQIGSDKHEADISLNLNGKIDSGLTIKSPLIPLVALSINHNGKANDFTSHGEIQIGSDKHEADISMNLNGKIDGGLSIKSPLIPLVTLSIKHNGNANDFTSHGEIQIGSDKHEADVSLNLNGKIDSGLSIKSPLIPSVALRINHNGNTKDFTSHGEIQIDSDKHEADISMNLNGKIDGGLSIKSPLIPLVTLSINHNGNAKDFTSHGEIQIGSDKHEADISLNLNGKIDSGISIKSPMIKPIAGKFVYENMNVQAEINIQNDIHKLDATLSMDRKIKSSIRVQSPLCETMDIAFQTNKNIRRLRSKFGLSYGDIEQIGVEMTSDFTSKRVSGSINARVPNNAVTGSFSAEGDMTDFNGHFESSWNDKTMEGDALFSMKDNMRGLIKLTCPSNNVELSFSHSGNYRHFESNGKAIYNGKESAIDMMLNTETAMKGSLRTSSPLSKPFVATFDHTKSKSVASVEYDQVKQVQVQASFSADPMQGNIEIQSPISGYEVMSAAFNHKGHTLSFSNHAEFAVNGERTEMDMSFNFGSKLEGKYAASSPYFPSTSASFDFSGKLNNFRNQISFISQNREYDVTASLDTRSGIDGSLTIKTPIQGYRTIVGSLTQTGSFPNVNAVAELKTGRRNLAVARAQLSTTNGIDGQISVQSILTPTLQVNVNHKGDLSAFTSSAGLRLNGQSTSASASFKQSPSLEGELSLSSPYFRPLSGNFKMAGGLSDFTSKIQGTAGTDSISGDVTFYKNNDAGVTVTIKTPFEDFETISGSAKYTKSYKGFTTDVNFDLTPMQKYELNAEAQWRRGMQGSMTIKTPFVNMRQSSITANYNGIFPNIQSNVAVECGDKKYAIAGELQHAESTSGKLSIETPLAGYESTGFNFNTQGDFSDFQADAQLSYANGKEIVASVQNEMSEGKLETKAKFESPVTEDFLFDLSCRGSMTDFTNSVVMSMGTANALTSTTTFKLNKQSLELESTLTTTMAGYTNEQKVVVRHDGPLSDMTSSAYVKVLGSEYTVDTSFKVASKIEGQFALRTPINNLKDVSFNFEHKGSFRRFSTKSVLQYDTNKKIQSTVQYAKYGSRRLQSSFELRTPFGGFENTKASYRHTASVDSFECETEMSIMDKDVTGSLRASNSPISATVSLTTPFKGFEQIGGDMKLSYGKASYATELTIAYMQGKTVSMSSEMDIESSPKTAHFKLTTPFEGYEDAEIRLSHNGDLMNFQSIASVSSTFLPSMRAQANLQSSSWKNMDAEITFSSQIRNLEALKFTLKNTATRAKYTNRVEASWSQDASIVMDNVFNIKKDSTAVDMSLSTPFEVARQITIKSAGRKSGPRYVEAFTAQYNGETYVNTELTVDIGAKKFASLQINSPTKMNIELGGFSSNGKYEGNVIVNKEISVDGSFDTKTNKAELKYNCPRNNIVAEATFDKTHPNAEITINNARYGYDMSASNNGGRVKIVLPSRSFVVVGKQNAQLTEGSLMWDADRDETKQIGFQTKVTPSRGSTKADFTLMMPSIGKDVQIDSEMIVNRGRVLFEGKGELTYSKDMRKKFTITSRLEDISNSWNSKNYSFSLGISHPYTSVGVELSSHLANSDDKITGAFDLKYQTVKRDTKSFSVNGEINKMKKSVNFDMDTPIKKISIAGNAQMEAPYSVSMMNKYDNRRPLRTVLSLDPSKRSAIFQMNYDEENPNNEFHVVAKYANSSAVSAEVFHVVNRKRVTDALVALRLNSSHLLHSRIHWRPDMINDLKEFTDKKANSYSSRFRNSMAAVSNAIQYEAAQKARLFRESTMEEMEPLMIVLVEQTERFIEMYDTNQYHVRDITDAVVASAEDVKLAYDEMVVASKKYLSEVSKQLKERASSCLDESMKDIEIVLEEINEVMEHFSERSNDIYLTTSEHMYNMTRHPRVIALQQQYNDYASRINAIPVQEHLSNMADKYTSAIYGVHDIINSHMASVMARKDVKYVKSISDKIVYQGQNAYKYWEVRENAEDVAEAIVDWIKSEIEKEISDLKATVMSIKKTSVTVYDPKHGEIQMEFHLPFPLRSLDEVPEVDIVPVIRKAKKYIPSVPKISMPSFGIPPYNAFADIVGDKVTTFDGLSYDLDGKCTFILTKDFVDGNFSIALNNGENRSLSISADGKNIVLLADGQVLVDRKLITLPAVFKNITITANDDGVTVDGAGSFSVNYYKSENTYAIELNGWYFGKVSGLLGTYDNEPSNEMMTSFGNVKNHAGRFSKSWDIGTARCR